MNKLIDIIERWLTSANFVSSSKVVAGVIAIIAVLIYLGYHTSNSDEPTPCSPRGFPGRCYHIDPDVCEVVWRKAEKACTKIIENLALPPGRLANPLVVKCQRAGLDKAFRYSRRSSTECDSAFTDLEGWVKRNDIHP